MYDEMLKKLGYEQVSNTKYYNSNDDYTVYIDYICEEFIISVGGNSKCVLTFDEIEALIPFINEYRKEQEEQK